MTKPLFDIRFRGIFGGNDVESYEKAKRDVAVWIARHTVHNIATAHEIVDRGGFTLRVIAPGLTFEAARITAAQLRSAGAGVWIVLHEEETP